MATMANGEWIADLENMTCRNINNNIVVEFEKEGIGLYGKIKDMPVELVRQWAKLKHGERLIREAVFKAEAVFISVYAESKVGKDEMQKKFADDVVELVSKAYGREESDMQIFVLGKKIASILKYYRENGDCYFDENRKYPQKIGVRSFPVKDGSIERQFYGKRYDLLHGENKQIGLSLLCSEKTVAFFSDNRIMEVFFASKDESNDFLYMMDMIHFSELLMSLQKNEEIGLEPDFDNEGHITEFKIKNKW